MTTDQDIIDKFSEIEKAMGGRLRADVREVLNKTAEALGLTYAAVRRTMLDYWMFKG